jgi:RNA polymerase sigma-70 factor (ECF subfamily)
MALVRLTWRRPNRRPVSRKLRRVPPTDSDEALMLAYRSGNVRAFEELVQRHRRTIFCFVLRFVPDRATAEDVTQDAFVRVIRNAATWEPQAKFTTWLFTIARNLCIDAARRAKHRRASSLDAPVGKEKEGATLGEFIPDGKLGADAHVSDSEVSVRIQRAVETLPEDQREVFLLREVADLQFNEIAELVGIPENTVKSRMRYALEKLRVALSEYDDRVAK